MMTKISNATQLVQDKTHQMEKLCEITLPTHFLLSINLMVQYKRLYLEPHIKKGVL